uniref:Ig-like domain-containing protein n=1 Tax=Thaumasiovibrio sp. DFM-14 TaxID=3384792 RepID=UPI0039A0D553
MLLRKHLLLRTISKFISIFLVVVLSGCFGNSNSEESQTTIPARDIELIIYVEDIINGSDLSEIDIAADLNLVGQDDDTQILVKDINQLSVAKWSENESVQIGDIKVPAVGVLHLIVTADEMIRSITHKAELNIALESNAYFFQTLTIDLLSSETTQQHSIQLLARTNAQDTPHLYVEQSISLSNNTLSSDVILTSPPLMDGSPAALILDGASFSLNIPSGTELLGPDGLPFEADGEVTISAMLLSADPKGETAPANSPLLNFPGGMNIDSLLGDGPDGADLSNGFYFISAGLVVIEIRDTAGNQATGFKGGVAELTMNVPKSTTNPNTGLPLSESDISIPLWGYSEYEQGWRYEGEALISGSSDNTLTVTTELSHLSRYNLDWYGQDRCWLDVDVVDAQGTANNQSLRLAFSKTGGGWAYTASGWGEPLNNLNIARVPAFGGTVDFLDSSGNSILASIEADGQVYNANTDGGVTLEDFCFGVTSNQTKSIKATLSINNPPRIDLNLSLSAVCPIDDTLTSDVSGGRYYLREGYSWVSRGELSSNSLTFSNLIEGGTYTLFYYGNSIRASKEFIATDELTELQLHNLANCPTVSQTAEFSLVCLDDQQQVLKSRPAASSWFWLYDTGYSQYHYGSADDSGLSTLESVVESINYYIYAYNRFNGRYWRSGRQEFTVSQDSVANIHLPLDSNQDWCLNDDPIDFAQSTITASPSIAKADGTSQISILVQEKDEFGNDRSSNTGTLTLNFDPSNGADIVSITSNDDGSYNAILTSETSGSVNVIALVDDTPLENSANVQFQADIDLSNSVFSLSQSSAAADGSAVITANLQLNDYAGSAFSGDVSKVNIALASGTATAGTLSDNGNGSYSVNFTSTTAGNVSISATYDGTPIGSAQAASFSAALDLSQSTFGLTSSSAAADGSAVITANLQLNDYAGSAFSGDVSKVSIALASGTATAGTLSDNGNGSYSVSFTSTTAGNVSISATYDGTPIGSAQAASFSATLDLSQSTFGLTSSSAAADGSAVI